MLTIAVANLKGGAGKSTVAVNLAVALHRAGHRVLVVDADGQGSTATWAAKAAELDHEGPPVVAINGKTLRRDLAHVARGFDAVVIDTPPKMAVEARAAMLVADLVLLPVCPGAPDVWALADTVAVLEDARQLRPELLARVVLNRATRSGLMQATKPAVAGLGVPVLGVALGNRVAFAEAFAVGQGVIDNAAKSEAALEVRRMVRAVLALLEAKAVAA